VPECVEAPGDDVLLVFAFKKNEANNTLRIKRYFMIDALESYHENDQKIKISNYWILAIKNQKKARPDGRAFFKFTLNVK
jgi:predicted P-loop ATPase